MSQQYQQQQQQQQQINILLRKANDINMFLAATKQLYEWFSPSVCLSVCPSVCLSHLFDYVPIIVSSWNFIITNDRSEVKVKGQGHRGQHLT